MIEAIDSQALQRIAGRDTGIFEQIHTSYYPEIRRFIYFRVSNSQLAEDLASAIFLRLFEYLSRGNAVDHIRGFLYRSAKNELANFFRDRKEVVDIDGVFTEEVMHEMDINQEFDFQIDVKHALDAVQKLKEEWRDIVLMRFLKELDYAEMAKVTGKSEGSIRVILHRALTELRNIIKSL